MIVLGRRIGRLRRRNFPMGDLGEWRAGSLIALSDEESGTDEGRSDETSASTDVCVSVRVGVGGPGDEEMLRGIGVRPKTEQPSV